MKKNLEALKWYLENGITEVIHNKPIDFSKMEGFKSKKSENTTKKIPSNILENSTIVHNTIKVIPNMPETPNESFKTIEEYIKIAEEASEKSTTVEELRKEVEKFNGCYSIKKLATNTVFSDGNPKSDILIVGEAPGNNEDLQGIPFCGMSGELLNSMFKAIGYKREDLYITNTLFWRPPGNRTPTPEELAMCKPFVEKHIALIKPKLIIMMGSTALSGILQAKETITRARRKFYDYTNKYLSEPIKATALFHPSYLLRQPLKKRDAWQDLLILKHYLKNN